MTLRALIFTSLLLLSAAAPAHAADTVLRTFDKTDINELDASGDRVAWTEDDNTLWTLEDGAAVATGVKGIGRVDVAAGPDGKPVAVYRRGSRFSLYDFAAKRERRLKSPGKVDNWAFWKDRFAVIRKGRLEIVPQGGKPRDVGRAKSLADKSIDFNGIGIAYLNDFFSDDDVEEFQLAYWPATGPGAGKVVMRAAHGASGDLSLAGAHVSPAKAYATQRAGEFGGPYRLWRVDLKSAKKEYAGLPGGANLAVPVGATQAVAYVCPREDEFDDEDETEKPCRLILRTVTWRR